MYNRPRYWPIAHTTSRATQVQKCTVVKLKPYSQVRRILNPIRQRQPLPSALLQYASFHGALLHRIEQDLDQFPASSSRNVSRNSAALLAWSWMS